MELANWVLAASTIAPNRREQYCHWAGKIFNK
jgi:hypothetical protein